MQKTFIMFEVQIASYNICFQKLTLNINTSYFHYIITSYLALYIKLCYLSNPYNDLLLDIG